MTADCRWHGVSLPFFMGMALWCVVFGWSVPTCTLDHTLGFLPASTCYSNHRCDIRSAWLNFTEVWVKSISSSWKLMSGFRFLGGWESVCVSEQTEMRSTGYLISLLRSEQCLIAEWTISLRMMRMLRLTCRQRETNSCYRRQTSKKQNLRVSEGELIYIPKV